MPSWSGQSCAREKVRQYGEKRRSEREEAHPVAEVIWEETEETADETAEATDEVAAAEEAEEELRAKCRVSLSVATKIRERGEGTHVSAASEDEDESSAAAAEEEDSTATVDVADSTAADEVAEPRSSETLTPTAAQYCRRVARQHGPSSLGEDKRRPGTHLLANSCARLELLSRALALHAARHVGEERVGRAQALDVVGRARRRAGGRGDAGHDAAGAGEWGVS